jgi:hypothetical protein
MPTAGLALSAGAGQIGFGLADTYARIEEPPYSSGAPVIIRNNNQASIEGRWSPGGGRLTGLLRYTNMVDIFSQGGYAYANSDTNLFTLTVEMAAEDRHLPERAAGLRFANDCTLTARSLRSCGSSLRGSLTERRRGVSLATPIRSRVPPTSGFSGARTGAARRPSHDFTHRDYHHFQNR